MAKRIDWSFDRHTPTADFFEGRDPSEDLDEVVEDFLFCMEGNTFLTWEAVIRDEQGLPLSERHEDALDGLLSVEDDPDDRTLYIDESPRFSEPWYEILRRIVPHLLIIPFRSWEPHLQVQCEAWERLHHSVEQHARELSLPEAVSSCRITV